MKPEKIDKVMTGVHKRITFLVGLPAFDTVPTMFHISAQRLQQPVNCLSEQIVVLNTEVGEARNYIATEYLKKDPLPEFLFFLGTDMLPGWDALINLWEIMRKGEFDVLSALYYIKGAKGSSQEAQGAPAIPILWRTEIPGFLREGEHYKAGETVHSDIVGLDFTLIRPSILKKIGSPYFKTGPSATEEGGVFVYTEDAFFCRKVKDAGGKIGVATSVRCAHFYPDTHEIF